MTELTTPLTPTKEALGVVEALGVGRGFVFQLLLSNQPGTRGVHLLHCPCVFRTLRFIVLVGYCTTKCFTYRCESRRHAAVLVLKELAENAPSLFYIHAAAFFEHIWVALRNSQPEIRGSAAKVRDLLDNSQPTGYSACCQLVSLPRIYNSQALRAVLALVARRESRRRTQWYHKIYETARSGLMLDPAYYQMAVQGFPHQLRREQDRRSGFIRSEPDNHGCPGGKDFVTGNADRRSRVDRWQTPAARRPETRDGAAHTRAQYTSRRESERHGEHQPALNPQKHSSQLMASFAMPRHLSELGRRKCRTLPSPANKFQREHKQRRGSTDLQPRKMHTSSRLIVNPGSAELLRHHHKAMQHGFGVGTAADAVHGSLLTIGELLHHAGEFMLPRFDECCDTILLFCRHRDRLVRRTVTSLLAELALYNPVAFVESGYLAGSLAHLLRTLALQPSDVAVERRVNTALHCSKKRKKKPKMSKRSSMRNDLVAKLRLLGAEKSAAFVALGHTALAVEHHLVPFLPQIATLITAGLMPARDAENVGSGGAVPGGAGGNNATSAKMDAVRTSAEPRNRGATCTSGGSGGFGGHEDAFAGVERVLLPALRTYSGTNLVAFQLDRATGRGPRNGKTTKRKTRRTSDVSGLLDGMFSPGVPKEGSGGRGARQRRRRINEIDLSRFGMRVTAQGTPGNGTNVSTSFIGVDTLGATAQLSDVKSEGINTPPEHVSVAARTAARAQCSTAAYTSTCVASVSPCYHEALACVAMLAQAVGSVLTPHLHAVQEGYHENSNSGGLIDVMFEAGGLSTSLTVALGRIVRHVPAVRGIVQDRLLQQLSVVLTWAPASFPSHGLAKTDDDVVSNNNSPSLSGRRNTDPHLQLIPDGISGTAARSLHSSAVPYRPPGWSEATAAAYLNPDPNRPCIVPPLLTCRSQLLCGGYIKFQGVGRSTQHISMFPTPWSEEVGPWQHAPGGSDSQLSDQTSARKRKSIHLLYYSGNEGGWAGGCYFGYDTRRDDASLRRSRHVQQRGAASCLSCGAGGMASPFGTRHRLSGTRPSICAFQDCGGSSACRRMQAGWIFPGRLRPSVSPTGDEGRVCAQGPYCPGSLSTPPPHTECFKDYYRVNAAAAAADVAAAAVGMGMGPGGSPTLFGLGGSPSTQRISGQPRDSSPLLLPPAVKVATDATTESAERFFNIARYEVGLISVGGWHECARDLKSRSDRIPGSMCATGTSLPGECIDESVLCRRGVIPSRRPFILLALQTLGAFRWTGVPLLLFVHKHVAPDFLGDPCPTVRLAAAHACARLLLAPGFTPLFYGPAFGACPRLGSRSKGAAPTRTMVDLIPERSGDAVYRSTNNVIVVAKASPMGRQLPRKSPGFGRYDGIMNESDVCHPDACDHAVMWGGSGFSCRVWGRGKTAVLTGSVASRLVRLAVADPDPAVRNFVLRGCLHPSLDPFLAQPGYLQSVVAALNDTHFSVRIAAAQLVGGRLAWRNPAYVLPVLRRAIVRLVTELNYVHGDARSQEDAAKLLGTLISSASRVVASAASYWAPAERLRPMLWGRRRYTSHVPLPAQDIRGRLGIPLIDPYVGPMLMVLLRRLRPLTNEVSETAGLQGDPAVAIAVLQTLGQLAMAVDPSDIRPFIGELLPLILRTLQDQRSAWMREVALRTLGQLVRATGHVVRPYLHHPTLLLTVLGFLRGAANQSASLGQRSCRQACESRRAPATHILSALGQHRKFISAGIDFAGFSRGIELDAEYTTGGLPRMLKTNTISSDSAGVGTSPWSLRREAITMLGIVGALDPFKHKIAQLRYRREQNESRLKVLAARKMHNRRIARARRWSTKRGRLKGRFLRFAQHKGMAYVHRTGGVGEGLKNLTDETNDSAHYDGEDNDVVFSPWDDTAGVFDAVLDSTVSPTKPDAVCDIIGNDGLLLPSMVAGGPEDYYPTVAITALMRILTDAGLHTHHGTAVQAVVFIFRSLGLKCVPFLPHIVPAFLRVASVCERGLRESIFQHLAALVAIVKQHIRRFLPGIFALINAFWGHSLEHILCLVEEISEALKDEFMATGIGRVISSCESGPASCASGGDYLASVVPRLLALLHSPHGAGKSSAPSSSHRENFYPGQIAAHEGRDAALEGMANVPSAATTEPSDGLSLEASSAVSALHTRTLRNFMAWHPATEKALHTLGVLGSNLGNHLYMVVPALVRLVDPAPWSSAHLDDAARNERVSSPLKNAPPFSVRKAAVITLRKLCCTLDVSAFTSQVVHAVVRMLFTGSGLQLAAPSYAPMSAVSGRRHLNPAMKDALQIMYRHSELRRSLLSLQIRSNGGSLNRGSYGRNKGSISLRDPAAAVSTDHMHSVGVDAGSLTGCGICLVEGEGDESAYGYDSCGYPRLPSPYPLFHALVPLDTRFASGNTTAVVPFDNPELVELREQALLTLCAILHQLGPAFVAYIPMVDRALYTLAVAAAQQETQGSRRPSGDEAATCHVERDRGRFSVDNSKCLLKYRLLVSKLLTNQPMPPQEGPSANMMVGLIAAMHT